MDTEAIIRQIKTGDTTALKTLYAAYTPMMKSVCRNITHEDEDTVNDLVQVAFVRAYYSLSQLRDPSKFGEWVAAITKNLAKKHMAKKQNKPQVTFMSVMDDELRIDDAASSDSQLAEKELLELIDQLPAGYKQVFRLSVIEGYSHQEIAQRLGIAPHSSSSQLARAKATLRKIISRRGMGFILLALASAPIAIYLLRNKNIDKGGVPKVDVASNKKCVFEHFERKKPHGLPAMACPDYVAAISGRPKEAYQIAADSMCHDSAHVSADSIPNQWIAAEETGKNDSTTLDTLQLPHVDIRPYLADNEQNGKQHRWQLLAAGSLGSALAQNVYKMFVGNAGGDPDGPQPSGPQTFSTWEDYYQYLLRNAPTNMSEEDKALMEIAINNANNITNIQNNGKITEHEHHSKPITFGLSLTKSIGDRWSIETGLQYTLLKSDFTLGEGDYYIKRSQKAHYLGIPVQASYKWLHVKNWSAYSSVGTSLHIPVYGKNTKQYVAGQSSLPVSNSHFTPSLQWSIGTSIGVQYQFAPKWGVYMEPSLHWYVPNGSSVHTIWTEHPFTFTLPFGIRFTW